MPQFRDNTWDSNIWNSIVHGNEYGIVQPWPHNVIDIGGHIGSFSFKMLSQHGTKKVVILEPNIDNYNLLINNLQEFILQNKVIAFNRGIGPPNSKISINNSNLGVNTGGSFYAPSDSGVDSISLDDLIDVVDDGSPILLKIDCEGCEYEALVSCTKLNKINCIVGEFHNTPTKNVRDIRNMLSDYHFSYHNTSSHLGLFGAHKK